MAEFTQVYARTKVTRWREHELLEEELVVEDIIVVDNPSTARSRLTKSTRELVTAVGILGLVSVIIVSQKSFVPHSPER